MSTARRLNDDDFCSRKEYLSRSWERNALSPMQLLARGIDHGLTCVSTDPGQSAGDHVMTLAVNRPIDTPREDLLGMAEHTAAIGDMIVYLLRSGDPWQRPEPINLGQHTWDPDSFLSPTGGLRRVVLCDRWDDNRAIAESFDWRTLEGAIYGLPMTLVVVVLGASREGRRHGPISKGWIHPVSQELRFRKRDGSDFGSTWNAIFRERFAGERDEWLDEMTKDSVAGETVLLVECSAMDPKHIRELASRKLHSIADARIPDARLSRCYDPIHPCQFSSTCPYFRLPSEALGFISLPGTAAQIIGIDCGFARSR